MEKHQVYSRDDIENEVNLYLNGAQRDKLDYILDVCTNIYKTLEIEEQIEFKSSAKAFCRTYGFLGQFCLMEIQNGKSYQSSLIY